MKLSRLGMILRPLRDKTIDLVYPRTCAVCGQRGAWVCDLCSLDVTPLVSGLCCDRCGHPVVNGRCECGTMHPAIARARSSNAYHGWIAASIQKYKYDRERDRAVHLAESMVPALIDLVQVDALVPVPLHPEREEWRGFNQAQLLANHLGQALSLPVENALQRTRNTNIQAHSSRDERQLNMRGAFEQNPHWSPRATAHYVLVDDVYTTGATVGACAEALDAAGVRMISVVTAAFDLQKRELEAYREMLRNASP